MNDINTAQGYLQQLIDHYTRKMNETADILDKMDVAYNYDPEAWLYFKRQNAYALTSLAELHELKRLMKNE